ncbi:glycoside hydrolase family 28 protein [Rufibacter psychrotolerans]|uniref:glycoside hydrolase family 28 protein n=1 Tax=Rufibacter psychrotolerans TaxID=2812556 RepID=UPI0019682CB0|nr:glycoside hydrolase family 28 protein [Rufibacter sp. SYSU D00308]
MKQQPSLSKLFQAPFAHRKSYRWFPVVGMVLAVALLAAFRTAPDPKEAILQRIKPPVIPNRQFNITQFKSASANGTNWKPAFDKAMQQAKKSKGGRIVVPAGTYKINGPIHFQSNTELHLQEGAVLVFSAEADHYLPVVKTTWEGTFLYNYSPFIYGYQLKNVAITGKGTIKAEDAQRWAKWRAQQKPAQDESRAMNHQRVPIEKRVFGKGRFLRPQLIQFFECENILVEDIRIEDSPFWCIHPVLCRNVIVRGVQFNAHNLNNDGIDPEFTEDVLIENISFNNGDDNIAIKAGRDHDGRASKRSSQNIIIRNCRFMGLHGVVMGSEMSAGVRNVYIENSTFAGKLKRGLYLKSNADRGGEIAHIYASNIAFGEVEDLIMITSKYKNEGQGYQTDIHDIHFNNITCQKATGYGITVEGFADKKVRNLFFNGITIDTVNIPVSIVNAEQVELQNIWLGGKKSTASVE